MFDESKHPRDKDGKFTDGNSFGGSDNGDKLLKAVNEYSKPKKTKRLTSAVMDKYSIVRKKVDKIGYAITYVNDGNKSYLIRINKSDNDFDYDIISEGDKNE